MASLARGLLQKGEFSNALTWFARSQSLNGVLRNETGLSWWSIISGIGCVYLAREQYEIAMMYFMQAQAILENPPDPRNCALSYISIGEVYYR
jgi:tetratricopeptide (TPR) repeat protein